MRDSTFRCVAAVGTGGESLYQISATKMTFRIHPSQMHPKGHGFS